MYNHLSLGCGMPPAIYQRLTEEVFDPQIIKMGHICLDDLIIFSSASEEKVNPLVQVLKDYEK